MSKQLLESDFLTVDLRSMFNKQSENPEDDDNASVASNDQQETDNTNKNNINQTKATNFDWDRELKKRLAANRNMSPESRQTDYDIETKFFKEFFTANWDAECAKQLMLIGEPLRKALKVLGFNKRTNPIFAFLSLNYVQQKLIKTKLLNINTFKAIYNAVANKLVADSEFFRASDYNIIYCQDLYKKPLKEIMEYLNLQSKVLEVSASTYTVEKQIENKKIFLYISKVKELDATKRAKAIKNLAATFPFPSVKSSKATLNSLDLSKKLLYVVAEKTHSNKSGKSHLNSSAQQKIAGDLDTPGKKLAAIQFLSMTTNSSEAKKALQNDTLRSISTSDLLKDTRWLAAQNIMPKGQLSTADADSLVLAILGDLQ